MPDLKRAIGEIEERLERNYPSRDPIYGDGEVWEAWEPIKAAINDWALVEQKLEAENAKLRDFVRNAQTLVRGISHDELPCECGMDYCEDCDAKIPKIEKCVRCEFDGTATALLGEDGDGE